MSLPTSGDVQQTHPYTCNTCQVAFRSSELQRGHMQSDWHRYNLKRRVASLPPLSSEIFAEKVLANKASQAATAARASYEKSCLACQKTYYSENAFINHLSSQKHKNNVSRQQRAALSAGDDAASMMSSTFSLGDPIETASNSLAGDEAEDVSDVVNGLQKTRLEDGESATQRPSRPGQSSTAGGDRTPHAPSATTTEDTDISSSANAPAEEPVRNCLFCNFLSPTFDTNIHHMTRQHGLFIPEREYITDLEGLVAYLRAKVTEGHECLYCGKFKHTTSGIMTHMRDRGHCKIAFDSEEQQLEIGDFYDFRATYSDPEGDDDSEWSDEDDPVIDKPSNGARLGARRPVKTAVEANDGAEGNGDDEGWETDSTLSSVPTDEIGSVPIDDHSHRYASLHNSRHHSHRDTRPHKSLDGRYHSRAHRTPHAVYYDDFEMHLPSGRSVGHRSLNRYWRQNLRNHPTPDERAARLALTNGTNVAGEGADSDSDSDVDMDAPTPLASSRGMQLQRGHDAGRQLATNSRADGGLGMAGVTAAKRKEVSRSEKREMARGRREENRYKAGDERRNNHQKHFRDPLLQ